MGKFRKTLVLGALAGLIVPPIAAAIAKQRLVPINDEAADAVDLVTIFDGGTFTSRAAAFRGGSALCWYGGLDIDLRGAQLDPAGAQLRVRSVFGGVRVIVPDGWRVRVRSLPILGGVDDDTTGAAPGAPTLDVDALAVFSGVQVTSRPEDDDELIEPPGARPAQDDGWSPAEDRADVLARAEVEAGAEAEASVEAAADADEAEADADTKLAVETPADETDPRSSSGA